MTTREEMALEFAKISYELAMSTAYDLASKALTDEKAAEIDRHIVIGAVEMADLLLEELNKSPIPH